MNPHSFTVRIIWNGKEKDFSFSGLFDAQTRALSLYYELEKKMKSGQVQIWHNNKIIKEFLK